MALINVVDQEASVRKTIADCLEKEGHEVNQYDSIASAEAASLKRLPDLLLMDLVFPDEDGLEYIHRLMLHERTRDLPIIIVSAIRQKKKIIEGLNAGAVDYITKPFELVELKVRVTAALKIQQIKKAEERNRELEAMRETARTIQYEIELPMREIQKCLVQMRNEIEDFPEKDRQLVNEAWDYFAKLEDILSRAQQTGALTPPKAKT